MDPARYRPGAQHRHLRRHAQPVAGRCAGGWLRNKRLAALAAAIAIAASALIFALNPNRFPATRGRGAAWLRKLHAQPGHRGHQPASGRAQRPGRAAGPQCPVFRHWQRRGGDSAGGVRQLYLGTIGFLSYRGADAAGYLDAALHPCRPTPPRRGSRPRATNWPPASSSTRAELVALFLNRRLISFGACVFLFHLSNAALLPFAASEVTKSIGSGASLVVAACIVVPQIVVAGLSPLVGRLADHVGHRLVLIVGFSALPMRAGLLAVVHHPTGLVIVQTLDGVSAAAFGVMLPLIAADITRGTNRFNLCMGVLGLAVGAGATLSTSWRGRCPAIRRRHGLSGACRGGHGRHRRGGAGDAPAPSPRNRCGWAEQRCAGEIPTEIDIALGSVCYVHRRHDAAREGNADDYHLTQALHARDGISRDVRQFPGNVRFLPVRLLCPLHLPDLLSVRQRLFVVDADIHDIRRRVS